MLQNCSEFSSQLCKQKEWTLLKRLIGLANPRGQNIFIPRQRAIPPSIPLHRQHITWNSRLPSLAPYSCPDAHRHRWVGTSTMSPSLMWKYFGVHDQLNVWKTIRDLRWQLTLVVVAVCSHAGSLQPHHSVWQPHLTEEAPFVLRFKASVVQW